MRVLPSQKTLQTKSNAFLLLFSHHSSPLHSSCFFPEQFFFISCHGCFSKPFPHQSLSGAFSPSLCLTHPPLSWLLSLTFCPHISFWLCLSLGPLSLLSTRLSLVSLARLSHSPLPFSTSSSAVFTVYLLPIPPVPFFFITFAHTLFVFLSLFTLLFSCCIKSVSSV